MKLILDVDEEAMGDALNAYFQNMDLINRTNAGDQITLDSPAGSFSVTVNNTSVRFEQDEEDSVAEEIPVGLI